MAENIDRALGRIEGKLDSMMKHQDTLFRKLGETNERITRAEKWQAKVQHWGSGALAVVGTLWAGLKWFWSQG